MQLKNLRPTITGLSNINNPEIMNYEDIFKGSAAAATTSSRSGQCFACAPWLIEMDTDAYFKDVFAGPVF